MSLGYLVRPKNRMAASYADYIAYASRYDLELRVIEPAQFWTLSIPSEDIQQLRFVINRSQDYNLSLWLEGLGIRVFNNSEISLLGGNKLVSRKLARQRGIWTLPLVYTDLSSSNVVMKPLHGHIGEGVTLLEEKPNALFHLFEKRLDNIVYDERFYIFNSQLYHCVRRFHSRDGEFQPSFDKNGQYELIEPNGLERSVLNRLLQGLRFDFGAVDFLVDTKGHLYFNELEDTVGLYVLSRLGVKDTLQKFFGYVQSVIGS